MLGVLFSQTYQSTPAQLATVTDHLGQQYEINLSYDQSFTLQGAIGASTLQVTDGRLRFIASTCSNKVCIHTGWLKHAGEAAACLPNRISVLLARNDSGFDSINF